MRKLRTGTYSQRPRVAWDPEKIVESDGFLGSAGESEGGSSEWDGEESNDSKYTPLVENDVIGVFAKVFLLLILFFPKLNTEGRIFEVLY